MRASGAPGGLLSDLAGLTWTYADVTDNADTYVTLFDVTGTGVIVAIWAWEKSAGFGVKVKLTIDGSVKWNAELILEDAGKPSGINTMLFFATSAKLEMKQDGGGASDAEFFGVVGVK